MSESTLLSGLNHDGLDHKLHREADLFESFHTRAFNEAANLVQNNPETMAYSAGAGFLLGASMAAISRNPGLLGKSATPLMREVARLAPRATSMLAAIDLNQRIALPMYTTFYLPLEHEHAKMALAHNVGTGVVEYGSGFAGALPGAFAGWYAAKPWKNTAPAFELKPSRVVGETPREVPNPEAYVSRRETDVADDVVRLYEKSFPKEERQPIEDVKELVAAGRILVHTTRDGTGKLHSFSFTSLHDETAMKFANLDFIATETGDQSRGLGSLHALRLNKLIKDEHPELVATTLEMEHPMEAGISAEQKAIRMRRARYYDRLDAPDTNVDYNIIDFEDPNYRGKAQWRAWVYDPARFNAVEAARLMMTDEGGYGLPVRGLAVRQFDAANNFWQPYFGPGGAGQAATPASILINDQRKRFQMHRHQGH